ncbi:MAG: (2Fe-2S)-binding protein [Proteobacteria bacterium]|nr:(2Fe-2S)-binding protein [Pseudomonadota bacterium]
MPLDLKVNGLTHNIVADRDALLIDVLRHELLLVGTKLGCGQEQCGCCVVLLDGAPIYACTTKLAQCIDKSVQTVEGLVDEAGHLHPLQQAFIDLNAAQCGYCTAGILMRAKALLDTNKRPERSEIIEALDGHLCRCGAHPRIIRAIERAALRLASV